MDIDAITKLSFHKDVLKDGIDIHNLLCDNLKYDDTLPLLYSGNRAGL